MRADLPVELKAREYAVQQQRLGIRQNQVIDAPDLIFGSTSLRILPQLPQHLVTRARRQRIFADVLNAQRRKDSAEHHTRIGGARHPLDLS